MKKSLIRVLAFTLCLLMAITVVPIDLTASAEDVSSEKNTVWQRVTNSSGFKGKEEYILFSTSEKTSVGLKGNMIFELLTTGGMPTNFRPGKDSDWGFITENGTFTYEYLVSASKKNIYSSGSDNTTNYISEALYRSWHIAPSANGLYRLYISAGATDVYLTTETDSLGQIVCDTSGTSLYTEFELVHSSYNYYLCGYNEATGHYDPVYFTTDGYKFSVHFVPGGWNSSTGSMDSSVTKFYIYTKNSGYCKYSLSSSYTAEAADSQKDTAILLRKLNACHVALRCFASNGSYTNLDMTGQLLPPHADVTISIDEHPADKTTFTAYSLYVDGSAKSVTSNSYTFLPSGNTNVEWKVKQTAEDMIKFNCPAFVTGAATASKNIYSFDYSKSLSLSIGDTVSLTASPELDDNGWPFIEIIQLDSTAERIGSYSYTYEWYRKAPGESEFTALSGNTDVPTSPGTYTYRCLVTETRKNPANLKLSFYTNDVTVNVTRGTLYDTNFYVKDTENNEVFCTTQNITVRCDIPAKFVGVEGITCGLYENGNLLEFKSGSGMITFVRKALSSVKKSDDGYYFEFEMPVNLKVSDVGKSRTIQLKINCYNDDTCNYYQYVTDLTYTVTGLEWEVTDNVLTIRCGGDMPDYSSGSAPWYSYKDSVTKVVIEEGATSIGNNAFNGFSKVTSYSLPSTLKSIGSYAMEGNYALNSISLPENLQTIGYKSFENCRLTSVVIPDSVTSIGVCAFRCNEWTLKSVKLPKNLKTIADSTFQECYALTDITFPENLETIGSNAFLFCHFTEITFPETLKSIGASAFRQSQIKNLVIPDSVTYIGYSAFSQNDYLETAKLSANLTELPGELFYDCDNLTTVTLSENLKSIGSSTFNKCGKLTGLTLPASLTSVGSNAFIGVTEKITFKGSQLNWTLLTEDITCGSDNIAFTGTASTAKKSADCTTVSVAELPVKTNSKYTVQYAINTENSVPADGWQNSAEFTNLDSNTKYYVFVKVTEDGETVSVENGIEITTAEHSWNDGEITTEANCVTNGVKTYTCAVCNGTKTETLSLNKMKHVGGTETRDAVAPTCVKDGYGGDIYCLSCNARIGITGPIAATGIHTWDDGVITTQPTCAAEGVKTYTCTVCETTKTEPIAKTTEHTWNDGVITTKSTCAKTGVKTYTCTVCEATRTETVAKTTVHTWDDGAITTQPTCAAEGVKTYTCTVCKTTKTEAVAKTTVHTWNDGVITTKSTCAKTGVKTYTCTVCEATRTETVAKTTVHTWNAGEITTEPTCAKTGVKTYTCTVCKATKTESVAKTTVHTWNDGVITTKATCAKTGVKTYTCTVCKATKTETIAKSTTHTYKNVVTAATLTKAGKIQSKCSVCGKVAKTTAVAKIVSVKLSKTAYTYTGKALKPTVTVKDSNGKVIKSTYYTVTYKNNTNVGKATVTVKFKGNYSGTKTLTFTISPKATTLSKVTSPKKATATVTVKKQATQTTGYEIQYSTSSKFTASTTKTVKITSAKTLTKTISKLTSGKTYYFRVRTYKTVSKVDYTSTWSTSVNAKIK